jgi:O-antigen/teichoic acid export membrane protein
LATNAENSKKIAKNTLALYFRQIIVMFVSLFTSRIVLQTLGVEDYGINNIVGGVVAMFGFISGTLMNVTQRFISVELGKGGDFAVLRKIFSTSMILHIVAGIAVLILAQTVGLWFLNAHLVISAERMLAANWVYQFAVFGFALSLLNAPLMALVISHEDMHIFGFMGIFDVVARLITVYLLVIVNADKLVFFALFGFAVSCLVWLFYFVYCRKKYKYARFRWVYDRTLVKEMSGFGGYTLGNSFLGILVMQGTNIMLNMFFGPAVNAAKGLANSVNVALLSFGNNFRMTLTPQITMAYAANKMDTVWSLVERGTRIYYFLFFVFSVPLLLETEFILKLWLGNVPEYTAIFTRFMIVIALVCTILSTFWSVVNASGKLKIMYRVIYVSYVLTLVFSYLALKAGYPPQSVFVVYLVIQFVIFNPIFILLAKKLYEFPIGFFTQKALVPMLLVSALSFFPFYFVNKLLPESTVGSFVVIITSALWTAAVIVFVGLRKNERVKIFDFVKRKLLKQQKATHD